MTISLSKAATATLLTSALALGACSRSAPEDLPPAPVTTTAPTTSTATPTPTPTPPSGPAVGSQSHFERAVGSSSVIYFDTDRFNIDSSDAAALQAQAQYFARYPQLTFTIEGHCDERGTREYNLALGERRANAAKNYLVSLGVDANRIRTVSYGKERPVALASNAAAWSQNRRAASIIIN
ncbi:MAG: peptidoglycan-associated lipoprotein Pal [Pseudomonadota bacterium]